MNHRLPTALLLLYSLISVGWAQNAARSEWVSVDPQGKLKYKETARGDRIMDFSSAGYMGGGVALPKVPVKTTLHPSGNDDFEAIQAAIDAVSRMEPVNGFRGAVLLAPGSFQCAKTLSINADGVVLRGSGSGANGTTIQMTGQPHVCISIGKGNDSRAVGEPIRITDAYVPSGTTSFHVAEALDLKMGEVIHILRPTTDSWVKAMGMADLTRDGKKEHWVSGTIEAERVIAGIDGKKITIDVPLSDSFDAQFLSPAGPMIVKWSPAERVRQVGVESLRIVSPPQPIAITEPQHQAIRTGAAADIWLKDLAIVDTVGSIALSSSTRRATVTGVSITHTVATVGSAKPADFGGDGTQLLFDRCSGTGDNLFHFVTGARVTGPIVLLNCTFHGNGHIQPHQRWATGLLVDGCQVPESGIEFMNRGQMGTGHGWTIGWAVAWNCVAKSFTIQQPPGAMNWAIGCKGSRDQAPMPFGKEPLLPEGTFDSHGTPVSPVSLYLAQLRERLGAQAVKNIGY